MREIFGSARRAFWCTRAGRDVEVVFDAHGVRSCTAFDPPTAVACGRPCTDPAFRIAWESPIPRRQPPYDGLG